MYENVITVTKYILIVIYTHKHTDISILDIIISIYNNNWNAYSYNIKKRV